MQPADNIKKILKGMTQKELAHAIGVNQSTISVFASGRNDPGPATCLALAGVCPAEDRDYWVQCSGLTNEALASIIHALGLPAQPTQLTADEQRLIDWWRKPGDSVEKTARQFIEQLLKVRSVDV